MGIGHIANMDDIYKEPCGRFIKAILQYLENPEGADPLPGVTKENIISVYNSNFTWIEMIDWGSDEITSAIKEVNGDYVYERPKTQGEKLNILNVMMGYWGDNT